MIKPFFIYALPVQRNKNREKQNYNFFIIIDITYK